MPVDYSKFSKKDQYGGAQTLQQPSSANNYAAPPKPEQTQVAAPPAPSYTVNPGNTATVAPTAPVTTRDPSMNYGTTNRYARPNPSGAASFARDPEDTPQDAQYKTREEAQAASDRYNTAVPKVYESVGEAGSGFINLSHLLGLNRKSGKASAEDLARRTGQAGRDAQGGIKGAEDKFMDEAWKGMGLDLDYFDPGAGDAAQARIDAAKKSEYKGPNDLASMSGYSDLQKKVSDAEDMAKNVAGGGYGVAAQVNKETGLSPMQSAASSFYMGVNNKNLKGAADPFTKLRESLDAANTRALDVAKIGRNNAKAMQAKGADWENQKKIYDAEAEKTRQRTIQEATVGNDEATTAANNAIQAARVKKEEHRTPEVVGMTQVNNNVKRGMPYELALTGLDYDSWVAAGRPKTVAEYNKKTGGHLLAPGE